MMKKISFSAIRDQFVAMCTRFPIALVFILAFTVCSICVFHEVITDAKCCFFAIFYTASAALLSVVLRLWDEETANRRLSWGVQLATQLGWLGFMFYFIAEWEPGIIRLTALISLMVAMVVAGFLLSFIKSDTDLPLWHFTFRTLLAAIVAVVVGTLFWGGISLLFASFNQLFSLQLWNTVELDIAIVCLGCVTPILFLQLLPGGEHKHDGSGRGMPRWANTIVRNLFVPLTAAYLVTLYVYAAKILITWQLPNGWVSWLVSVLMLIMVVLTILFYPSRFDNSRRFDRTFTRLLPILVLPLLLLMTIGIVRRFSDYGITVLRLYLALFNLWCYGVCLWLIVRKPKRIAWIPASFAIILVAASVGPQSVPNITLRSLTNQVRTDMRANGIDRFPIDKTTATQWQVDTTQVHQRVTDKLSYLVGTYTKRDLIQLADSAAIAQIRTYYISETAVNKGDLSVCSTLMSDQSFPVPPGKHHCASAFFKGSEVRLVGDTLSCTITLNENGHDRTLPMSFSVKQLRAMQSQNEPYWTLNISQATVYLSSLYYYVNTNTLTFQACIFY
ncbi:MAG: DUF4153 domain-containing protein [Prevotella sp.]|jgi:hypothetical protein